MMPSRLDGCLLSRAGQHGLSGTSSPKASPFKPKPLTEKPHGRSGGNFLARATEVFKMQQDQLTSKSFPEILSARRSATKILVEFKDSTERGKK